MVTFENLAFRACAFTGAGTLLAVLANATFGVRQNLLVASVLGAAIGSSIGWILLQHKLAAVTAAEIATQASDAGQRPVRNKAAP